MGEGNITRREFYNELDYWEIIRIYNGIQRRYRALRERRQLDFMYLCSHWNEKDNGPAPKSAYEWMPFPWDPVVNPEWEKWERDSAIKLLEQ